MGFYVGIAVAVGLGIYFGSIDERIDRETIKAWGELLKIGLLILGQIILCLAILGGIVYLFYRLFKATDRDVVGIILLWLAFIVGFIFVLSWLYKITHRK